MVHRLVSPIVFVVLLVIGLLAPMSAEAQATRMACGDLLNLRLPDTTIKSATEMPAGPFAFGNTAPTCASPVAATELPGFCRVEAVVAPAIGFEVWLPLDNWNGKFQGLGNHGNAGNIEYSDMGPELVKGYAVAGTDTGHFGNDTAWMTNRQQVIDYGYRGVHEMTVKSKAIVQAFYGQPARYSYFNGCSTGGKEGLMEAQRYPDDYDGIAVGDPNFAQIHNRAQHIWNAQVTFAKPGSALPAPKLALINTAAVAACDSRDGVVDGVIDDPLSCPFQPSSLLCKAGQDSSSCLTQAEVTAVEKVYEGPRNPRTGEQMYAGFVKGSERGWAGDTTGPNVAGNAVQFFRMVAFGNPNWDWKTLDWDKDLAAVDAKLSETLDAINPDLSAFRNSGGKILHHHSYSSIAHSAPQSITYFEQVAAFLNKGLDRGQAIAKTQEFYRLFMAPGGSGSKGPGNFDPIPYLERWVEKGIAPDRINASNITNGVVDRTRALCPYPQMAAYTGSGSTDEAKNFVCRPKPGSD